MDLPKRATGYVQMNVTQGQIDFIDSRLDRDTLDRIDRMDRFDRLDRLDTVQCIRLD